MHTYLLTWNPNESSVREVAAEWRRLLSGRSPRKADWSCGVNKSIEAGSRVFLHRQRREPRGIVSSGVTVSRSYEGRHWDDEKHRQGKRTIYVDWLIDAAVDGFGDNDTLEPFAAHLVPSGPIHDLVPWSNMQGSGTRVHPDAAAELERQWAMHLGGAVDPVEPWTRSSAKEGAIEERLARSRYRERTFRQAKIAKAIASASDGKLRCEVPGCGFCFEDVYGPIGRDFAHVHHLRALRDAPAEVTTTFEDLAIVCANCHAMIHRGRECRPLTGLVRSQR
ncbi:MAG: HNH endonuclease [Planctomycetaceae bacterium]